MRSIGALKVVIATCAFALIAPHLSPATAAPAAQLVTCVDLASGKERVSKTGTCRTTEAMAKWRLSPVDSAFASGSTTKTLTVCSNKESSLFTYQLIRSKCARHMQSGLYTRSSALPAKPVIAQVSATSYESASLALASDPAASLDAPIAYYTITSSKGDVKKVNSWRDLNMTVSGLRSATSYTFTITATNVDGTSPVSVPSLSVTTQVYLAPVAPTTVVQVASCANGSVCVVGDPGPGGGTVFYVATTPFDCGPNRAQTCSYLEAAPALWSAGAAEPNPTWAQSSPVNFQNTGINNSPSSPETATATAIGWGYRNTRAIILQGNTDTATSAAALADSHTVTVGGVVVDDWYLPSKNELLEMCKWQRNVWTSGAAVCFGGTTNTGPGAEGFEESAYWSSTEFNGGRAQIFDFRGANASSIVAVKSLRLYVRPIRAFGPTSVSIDARLSNSSTIKGQTPLALGTPSAILASATGGSVSINSTQSADTTNAGSYRTTFTPVGVGANINRVVKYSAGANYSGFASDSVYNGMAAITGGDFFIIKVLAQDGLTILYYKVSVTVTYAVGSTGPGGGTIFYVALSPFACGPTRSATCTYLEAAAVGWDSGSDPRRTWADVTYDSIAVNNANSPETATATAIGWGYRNTRAIILQGNTETTTSAAALADSHTVTVSGVVYDDWYLPSKDELNQMCKWQRGVAWTSDATVCIGGTINTGTNAAGFEDNDYWSSTESIANSAWFQYFGDGSERNFVKSGLIFVQPVRAF